MVESLFRYKHCERKLKYTSVKMAEKRIKDRRKKGHIVDGLNIYKCKYCGYFHIGHKKTKGIK